MLHAPIVASILLLASNLPAVPQSPPHSIGLYNTEDTEPLGFFDRYGEKVAGIGEVNGDGCADYLIRSYVGDAWSGGSDHHRVSVISGATGNLLYLHDVQGTRYGWDLAKGGDHDQDGISDYLISNPDPQGHFGVVSIHSGADHGVIYQFVSPYQSDLFGHSIDASMDFNADGTNDILIGAPNNFGLAPSGRVDLFDGRTFTLLNSFSDPANSPEMGEVVALVGDVDGDGVVDIAAKGGDTFGTIGFMVFSGSTASILYSWIAGSNNTWLGHTIVALGDVNQDGHADWATGDPDYGTGGAVNVFNGADGLIISSLRRAWTGYGETLDVIEDQDGNGVRELVIGSKISLGDGGLVEIRDPLTGTIHNTVEVLEPHDLLGRALAVTNDLNGDGRQDLIISSGASSPGPLPVHAVSMSPILATPIGIGCGMDQNGEIPSLTLWSPPQVGGLLRVDGTALANEPVTLLVSEQPEFIKTMPGSVSCFRYFSPAGLLAGPIPLTADSQGDYTFQATVPAIAFGMTIVLQAINSPSANTNGVIIRIP